MFNLIYECETCLLQYRILYFIGKPADLYDRNNPDWTPTQNMGHKKIKCRRPCREKKKGRRPCREKKKVGGCKCLLLEISQEVSNEGNKPLPALGTFLFW